MAAFIRVCVCVCRVIDVGSEWRTFSNDKSSADRSRVGAAEVSLPHYLLDILYMYMYIHVHLGNVTCRECYM